MTAPWRRGLVLVALLLAVVVGVHGLREATQSTHYSTAANSQLVVEIDAGANRAEPGVTVAHLAEAQTHTCALEVARAGRSEIRPVAGRDDQFVVTLRPALDSTDRKQYRGCLEDWSTDHLRIEVRSMTDRMVEEDPSGAG